MFLTIIVFLANILTTCQCKNIYIEDLYSCTQTGNFMSCVWDVPGVYTARNIYNIKRLKFDRFLNSQLELSKFPKLNYFEYDDVDGLSPCSHIMYSKLSNANGRSIPMRYVNVVARAVNLASVKTTKCVSSTLYHYTLLTAFFNKAIHERTMMQHVCVLYM